MNMSMFGNIRKTIRCLPRNIIKFDTDYESNSSQEHKKMNFTILRNITRINIFITSHKCTKIFWNVYKAIRRNISK